MTDKSKNTLTKSIKSSRVLRASITSSGLDNADDTELFSRYKGPDNDSDDISPVVKNMIEVNNRNAEDILPTVIIRDLLYRAYDQDELARCSIIIDKTESDALYGHINDPRMGVAENRKRCKTCGNDNINCTGHYGVIILPYPIYHPLFVSFTIKVLNMCCSKCSRLKMPTKIRENLLFLMRTTPAYKPTKEQKLKRDNLLKETIYQELFNATGINRLNRIAANYIKECPVHGSQANIKYKPSGNLNAWNQVICEYDTPEANNVKSIPPIEDIQRILKNISDDDISIIGLQNGSHPKDWILNYWVVLPPNDRPPVKHDVTSVWKDQLTRMYEHILKIRASIEKLKPNISEADKVSHMNRLYFCIAHFIDNSDKQYAQGTKGVHREFITLKQLIQGKEALIRNLMMGKRVNYTARTVLSPDPTLRFGQIRLPREWAKTLTKDVDVNSLNIEHVKKLLSEGRITHYYKGSGPDRGQRHQLLPGKTYYPEIGDKIVRWLQDGDYVIFNRQPTLYRFGFMAMEVKLATDDDLLSIGLPMAYSKAYNYDFDGDEGNIHDLQTVGANVESMTIANVVNMIMDPYNNKPMLAIFYNGLVGAYLLTQPDTIVDKDIFIDCIASITERSQLNSLASRLETANVYGLSGRALFSALLPEDFTYSKGDVRIINGVLLAGTITGNDIGQKANSIISQMHKDYPVSRVVSFLTDLPFVIDRWMVTRNFSLGYADCQLNIDDFEAKRSQLIKAAQLKIDARDAKDGSAVEKEHHERYAMKCVTNVTNKITSMVMDNMNQYNAFSIIHESGVKSMENSMMSTSGIVGQQVLYDERFKPDVNSNGRCLPYFEKDSTDITSRGFCVNSYVTGLTPPELYFIQAAGRKNLMDTAINTAITGTLHHKIVKALEKLKVAEDGSTRNANNKIFQYTYGDDSFDPSKLIPVKAGGEEFLSFTNVTASIKNINAKYGKYVHEDVQDVRDKEDKADWSKKSEVQPVPKTFLQSKMQIHRKYTPKEDVAKEVSANIKKLSQLQKEKKVDPSIFTATEMHGSRYEKKAAADILTKHPPKTGESESDYIERILSNL
jgi:DNA-directed RNA polymerase II subunit RPB1